jgi:frataxin
MTSIIPRAVATNSSITVKFLSTVSQRQKGILPDAEDPQPRESVETVVTTTPADLTDAEYHALADDYLAAILSKFEELQDEREDVDVEYSVRLLFFQSHCPPP